MQGPYTRALASYIAGSRFEQLPAEVVAHARLLVLDTIGVAVFGATLPWSARLRETLQSIESPGSAAVWRSAARLSPPSAAMVNGTAVHAFELDDVGPGGHNGSVTLPSALAIAEHRGGVSGAALINAVVVGIETAARVNLCVGKIPHEELGFHNPGLMGTFASVASAAKAQGLTPDQVVHALGHAGQQAASLMFTHHGGMGKRLLAGQAARAGTLSALLSAHGFTNAANVFEAEYGGFPAAHTGNAHPPRYDLSQLTRELGEYFHTPEVRFKMWASRVPNHGTLEAMKAMRRERAFCADEVKAVRIRLGKGYLQNVGWTYTPTTITSAQLNLFYVAAIMLLENDVSIGQFTDEKIRDPKVLQLIERITVTHDPSMDAMGYADGNPVEVELTDGTVLSHWGKARGGRANPAPREDVVAKFRKLTEEQLSRRGQDELIDLCDRLAELPDARALTQALQTGT